MRKSYNGLSLLVQEILQLNPLSGHLFVFYNKRLDRVKILYWDRDGFCIWQKRLEQGRFVFPSLSQTSPEITLQELYILLSGFDLKHIKLRPTLRYRQCG